MIRITTLFAALCMAFATPAFADPASDALAGEQAAEATEAAPEAAAEDAAAPEAPEEAATEAAEESAPQTLDEAADTVGLLVKAVQDKNWALAVGFLMMLLVFIANKFGLKDKVGTKAIPWVVMGVSVASVSGAALIAGVAIPEVIMQGVLAGVAAIGGWELMFKHLLVKKTSEE
jgi:hypothetical protein